VERDQPGQAIIDRSAQLLLVVGSDSTSERFRAFDILALGTRCWLVVSDVDGSIWDPCGGIRYGRDGRRIICDWFGRAIS
jgi:hypothetical protein